jgi:2-aminoadipate transaminase
VQQAMDNGSLVQHIEVLKDAFRSRLETMHEALLENFSTLASWTKPAGGYFFWLRFDDSIDTEKLKKEARKRETGFQNGTAFSTRDGLHNYLRLSFAHYDEEDIRKGIERLRTLF